MWCSTWQGSPSQAWASAWLPDSLPGACSHWSSAITLNFSLLGKGTDSTAGPQPPSCSSQQLARVLFQHDSVPPTHTQDPPPPTHTHLPCDRQVLALPSAEFCPCCAPLHPLDGTPWTSVPARLRPDSPQQIPTRLTLKNKHIY